MDPVDGLRSVRQRLSDHPVDALAQSVAERVIDLILRSVDVNTLLAQVDLNQLLAQVDIEGLLARVDVNGLLARVDIDELMSRVDLNSIVDRVDIDSLVEHTDLGRAVAKSSSTLVSGVTDVVRSQAFGLDELVARAVAWLLRRQYHGPPGPPVLLRPGTPAAAPVAGP